MNRRVTYYGPEMQANPCHECEWQRYDTSSDETWCAHEPEPDGLYGRRQIDGNGTCGYWESQKGEDD